MERLPRSFIRYMTVEMDRMRANIDRMYEQKAAYDKGLAEGRNEGQEKGQEKGHAEGLAEGQEKGHADVLELLVQGLSIEEIKQRLKQT